MNTSPFVKSGSKTRSTGKCVVSAIGRKTGGKLSSVLIGAFLMSLGGTSPLVKAADKAVVSSAMHSSNLDTSPKGAARLPSSGLAALYPFNGNANDESGFANHGDIYGATLMSDRFGNSNSAYNFNGDNNFIDIGRPIPGYLEIPTALTISAWVKPLAYSNTHNGDFGSIVASQYDPERSCYSIMVDYREPRNGGKKGGIYFQVGDGSKWWTTGSQGTTAAALPLGAWTHVAAVADVSGRQYKVYFNGQLIADWIPGNSIHYSNNCRLTMGWSRNHKWLRNANRYFNGAIDDVSIYSRALSAAEIQQLFHQGIVNPYQLVSLGDINNDNSPDIAVVTYNAPLKKSTAQVKSSQTGGLVQQIAFDGGFVPAKVNVLPDLNNNGAPEIAVLGVRGSDQAVQVEVRDSLSGVKISVVPFDSTFKALDLSVVRDISGKGTVGLAVLQQSDTELRVELNDALSGAQIRNIIFTADYNGIDLLVLDDLNGNEAKEIAVLADNKTTNAADTVEIRDSKTGELIRNISYGTGKAPQQLINLPDQNNSGGPELAVLRANTARVLVKDANTGLAVNTLDYFLSQPFKLATVADSNSQTHLAMLGVRTANGQARADVHDALTDTFINKVVYDNYGATVGFISIPDINGNGVSELVRLREQPGPQKLFAEIRDGRTGELLQGMYF